MGICPSLDPETRVIQSQNSQLKSLLISQLKDLRIYNFYSPVMQSIQNLPMRYMYNEGILEDIQKLHFYSERRAINSIESRVSLLGQDHYFDEQLKNSCLILENEVASQIQSKQLQSNDNPQQQQNEEQPYANINPKNVGTQSFQNNLTRNQSLVAQMNILYGRQIKRQEYSQAMKLFLKWVQYFNEHSYGGFIKPIYKSFCQSLYSIEKSQLETLIDQVSIFVQYMVKIYTKIYNLEQLNKAKTGKLFKNENIYNLVMSFLFKKTKIKQFIRVMVRDSNMQKIKKFEDKLRRYSKKGVGYWGIQDKFVLVKKDDHNQKKANKNYGDNQDPQLQPPLMLESFKSQLPSSCYQVSQRLVAQLSSPASGLTPISKLKTIIAIAKQIKIEIEQFYVQQLNVSKEKVPQLDPDNLTAIVMYLITVNNQSSIFQELKIIQYFTTTNTLNCISGYYLNLFSAAVEMIIEKE